MGQFTLYPECTTIDHCLSYIVLLSLILLLVVTVRCLELKQLRHVDTVVVDNYPGSLGRGEDVLPSQVRIMARCHTPSRVDR